MPSPREGPRRRWSLQVVMIQMLLVYSFLRDCKKHTHTRKQSFMQRSLTQLFSTVSRTRFFVTYDPSPMPRYSITQPMFTRIPRYVPPSPL